MKIIKRNGAEESFDEKKIMTAVSKANLNGAKRTLTKAQIADIAEYIAYKCEKAGRSVSVEEIQDMVESQIMAKGAFDVAQRYIKYRYTRAAERQGNTTDARVLSLIECNNEEVKQENSNKNPVINSVQRDYMAGEVSRDLTQRMLLPKDIVEADKLGIIHFHDADYYAQHMHNCFLGTTQFVTADGVKQFNEYNDGDTVEVVDKYGVWRTATVHRYEAQPMQVVTFATKINGCKITKKVTCTADHRWILHDGTVTTDLRIGMKLQPTAIVKNDVDIVMTDTESAKAWCVGYIIGRNDAGNAAQLSVDSDAHKAIFEKAGYTVADSKVFYGNVAVYGAGLAEQQFLDGQLWRTYTKNLKASLFAGLLAGKNAKVGRSEQLCMTVVDPKIVEMVDALAPLYGCYITKTLRVFDRDYRKDKAYYFMQSQTQDNCWTVTQIKPYRNGRLQQTWCVEEPVTHSFMLADGIVTGNCDLVNLEDMLQNGTVISETLIEKPHSFSTACNIATQIIAQVASSQYGGQSISLAHLAPFVQTSREKIRREFTNELNLMGVEISEDKFNEIVEQRLHKEIEKGVQTIQYQVVTLMTTNGQAPFLTVFMYLNEAKNENEKQDLARIIEEMLRQRYQGVKNEAGVWITPAFPKLIYVLENDNVEEDSPYFYLTELAAKCTAKRLVPDYISEKVMLQLKVDKNGEGHCYTCMGCRSFLTPYVDENGKPKYYGRFNQGVVTINLVDVALSSGGDMDKFWKIFDERLALCYRALMCRHERLKGTLSDAAPILWQYGALARLKKGEPIDKLLYGGYSTISLGYAGLCECTRYMTGKSHTDPEATPFALEVMQYMNTKCAEWKAKENIDFSIYGTPLESTTYKFAKCLQKRFGVVKGVTDKNYITNSYHIHVTEQVDAFTKLKFESQFQALSPGGAISYVEVPNMQNNIPAVIKILKCIYENIMYAELNTKSDYCQVCGYDGEIQIVTDDDGKLVWECPKCGNRDQNKLNVARRTCGYIGSNFWNQGRTQEIKERVLHL